jgi:membrane-associated phospholipid phosphatase
MSNTPIVLGWCGWAASLAALLYKTSKNKTTSDEDSSDSSSLLISKAGRHFLISVIFYLIGGGTILHGDPWLVKIIKEVFQRARPTELSWTYAFPSGHTTSAAFVIGALLFIILPAVLEIYTNEQQGSTKETLISNTEEKLGSISNRAVQLMLENIIIFWILCVATTASGRVIADVHWSTDVMAGACLGTGLVALTSLFCSLSDSLVVDGKESGEV